MTAGGDWVFIQRRDAALRLNAPRTQRRGTGETSGVFSTKGTFAGRAGRGGRKVVAKRGSEVFRLVRTQQVRRPKMNQGEWSSSPPHYNSGQTGVSRVNGAQARTSVNVAEW